MNPALKTAREIILKEIKYLSGFYPYNLGKFIDSSMLHASSMLVFSDPSGKFTEKFLKRIINLMAGLEFLAAGINLHNFNTRDFIDIIHNRNADPHDKNESEKNYTVRLLFGDVFYSRAVIYILKYGDFNIFSSILESLKSTHMSRLVLHRKLIEILSRDKNKPEAREKNVKNNMTVYVFEKQYKNRTLQLLEEKNILLAGINSLLKTSFLIGSGIFYCSKNHKLPLDTINDFVLLKSFNDLNNFFNTLPDSAQFSGSIPFIGQKKEEIIKRIDNSTKKGTISELQPCWLKNNFLLLEKIFKKIY